MAELATRRSALDGHVPADHIGEPGAVGVNLAVTREVQLWQVAAWPDTVDAVAKAVGSVTGAQAPGPRLAISGPNAVALRVEPLKWWILNAEPPTVASEQGAVVDLSHARTQVTLSGPAAADCLMRHLPLDLREESFPVGSVASTAFHHVGVTLWRNDAGIAVFLPRGFALSLWQLLLETAAQFGARAQID